MLVRSGVFRELLEALFFPYRKYIKAPYPPGVLNISSTF